MSDIFKFPQKGYEVKVLRKEDVLASIDKNIIDKDVALAIVRRCEIDAATFLKEGRWASIPYIGNIRIPKTVQKMQSSEYQDILRDAQATLDPDKYILFKKSWANDVGKQVKQDRYYRYIVSKLVGKNTKLFRYYSKKYGDMFARILCYTLNDMITDENILNNYE